MKKSISALLALALCFCVFVGCVVKKEVHMSASSAPSNMPSSAASEEPAAPSTAVPAAEIFMFPWKSHTLGVAYALDDGTVKSGTNTPKGKFVQVFLKSMDDNLKWEEISKNYVEFSLRDTAGTEYVAVASGFKAVEGSSINISDLDKSEYIEFSPIFDVAKEASLDDLTLLIKTENINETITVALVDVPRVAPPES